jgi:hypothetical protein
MIGAGGNASLPGMTLTTTGSSRETWNTSWIFIEGGKANL